MINDQDVIFLKAKDLQLKDLAYYMILSSIRFSQDDTLNHKKYPTITFYMASQVVPINKETIEFTRKVINIPAHISQTYFFRGTNVVFFALTLKDIDSFKVTNTWPDFFLKPRTF